MNRKAIEMFKDQKKQVFVFGIVAILCISLATPVAKAALDIERIGICSQKDHLDGTAVSVPWRFEFSVHLIDPDTLDHINVTPPAGGTPFTIYEDSGDWEYDSSPTLYATLTALQAVYPTGTYTLDFRDSGGGQLKSVQLDYSGIGEPGSPVDFTYPSYDGQTGISTNPTLAWTVNSGAGDALGGGCRTIMRNSTVWMVWMPGPSQWIHFPGSLALWTPNKTTGFTSRSSGSRIGQVAQVCQLRTWAATSSNTVYTSVT